ncbi:ABC transporter ATP-binding protein [Rugosimonospora africana]|uniref:Dipeptide/oligopeptide/nickel ABC transporter ATP-binding protein n=1 Tax=Rugosimonospora africana TaxID=556532 RepID=A0A8J3R4J3_9ACTN|nr:ABC transporter ATP-binding protein [Rugosimonospora africana]GIH21200.1 dipeptide/oligopeptide/nickel ABC transporter ATP-binding protein [Rugosimonospora africana]
MSALLEVRDLAVRYGGSPHHAVDGVSFTLGRGEVLGIVGESGSGKTTLGLALLGLLPAGAHASGAIRFDGDELLGLPEKKLRRLRGTALSTIVQNASTALDPCFTVGTQLTALLRRHRGLGRDAARREAVAWLAKVGIPAPETRLKAYPHQLSGGMNQRVVIAMALALSPKLVIADEPTSALDVTVQAQVIRLLRALIDDAGSSMALITHDLGVVAQLCSQVVVMNGGVIVERGTVEELFAHPRHSYTRRLLASLPSRRTVAEHRDPSLPAGSGDQPATAPTGGLTAATDTAGGER